MNKYIKLLEDFDADTDLTPIMPVEEKDHDEHEVDEDAELEVISLENSEGTHQWFVVDLNSKKGVAGPFVEKADAVREIEVMQGKTFKKEEEHEQKDEHEEEEDTIEEGRGSFDPSGLIFMAAQYTEEDLEPLANQMWSDPNDLVGHILDSIEGEDAKMKFLADAKSEYPEITITA